MNKTPGQKQMQQMTQSQQRMADQRQRSMQQMAQSQQRMADQRQRIQQQQMADQRQRSMQHAWMQKQRNEARQMQDSAKREQGSRRAGSTWHARVHYQADERFSQVEAKVEKLKKKRLAGRLSEEEFNDQLKNLMVEDGNGNWWMIGIKTDAWYRFDGQNWIQSTPPRRWVHDNNAVYVNKSTSKDIAAPIGHPFRAIIQFLFLVGLFAVLGFFAGMLVAEVLGIEGIPPFIAAGFFWVFGFFFAISRSRQTWRGW